VRLKQITLSAYQLYINDLLVEHALAESTVKTMHINMIAIINYAVAHKKLKANTLTGVIIKKNSTPKKRHLEDTEKAELDKAAKVELRHTFSTLAIARGLSSVEVSKWIGHSKTSVTLINYTHNSLGGRENLTKFVNN